VIRLALVALAAAGAVWLSDDLVRFWSSDAVAERRLEAERWLEERLVAPVAPPEEPTAIRSEAPSEAVEIEPPAEFAPREVAPPGPLPPLPSAAEPAPVATAPSVARTEQEVAPEGRLSRAEAERVRSRLGRVMTLAGRSGR
jgi:hypothetical protein